MEILRVGSKGDSVRSLQLLLNQRGIVVDVDGVFGEETEDAIMAFQKTAKLSPDGIVGEMTWNCLLKNEVNSFVSKINKSAYLVNERSYYPEPWVKKNIVLHHTAGWVVAKGTKDTASMTHVAWWNSRNAQFSETQGRVATAFSIDYHGNIYQHFDPKLWAYHLGLGRANNYLDKQSIGIEITNEGYMKLDEKGDYVWFAGELPIKYNRPQDEPFKASKLWRGYEIFAPYSKEQIDAAVWLCKYLCDEFNIPVKTIDHCDYIFDDIKTKKYEGIYNHANVRKDKFDLSPAFPFSDFARRLRD